MITRRGLLLGGLLLVNSPAWAALPPKPLEAPVSLSVAEILAMPAENRLQIAQSRRVDLLADLEAHCFREEVDFSERWKALVLYAQLAGPRAKSVLDRAVSSKDWFMRNAGLVAYQDVLPQQVVGVAKKLLNDKALVVRSAAIDVLQAHLDSEVRELLWGEIDQPRNFRKKQGLWTRPQILEILAREPQDRELPLFVGYLREKDSTLHLSAMQGLEKLTRRNLGKPNLALSEKRELWLAWAKKSDAL